MQVATVETSHFVLSQHKVRQARSARLPASAVTDEMLMMRPHRVRIMGSINGCVTL